MGKVKIKKNDIWIDMTPKSDVINIREERTGESAHPELGVGD